MTKASENIFPQVRFSEETTLPTPATDEYLIGVKDDGKAYLKNDAGTETDLTASGGGGSVGSWTSYSPAWTVSSGTNPSIGNGTITGRYVQHGSGADSLIIATAKITIGSTTTVGSGAYRVSLPVAVSAPDSFWIGSFLLVHASDSNRPYPGVCLADEPRDAMFAFVAHTGSGANTNWNNSAPVTLATGDTVYLSIAYSAES
jgi:hypothetical protein